jgi:cobalt/nickel transport system ATP-binding protein
MSKIIEIRDFSYHYSDGTEALKNIDLGIEDGQRVVLIGPNGAGKSTLLLTMAGFIEGDGTVLIEGIKVTKKNIKRIRTLIGSCLDNPEDQLFMPTIFDDVSFGPLNMGLSTEAVEKRVEETLKRVGLEGMSEKAPHHLSAGQKRAAAIATILSMAPKIITFDEPDNSLDPRSRDNLLVLLKNLSQTLVIATCSMDFAAAIADRAVLLDGGQIIADGKAKDIMANTELMKAHGLEVPVRFL